MKSITIANPIDQNSTITMMANYEKTRNGFRHLAETDDGVKTKCVYWNRTWECYTYQTVLHSLAWAWIEAKTGLKPKTKRDGAKFHALLDRMCADIDSKRTWW